MKRLSLFSLVLALSLVAALAGPVTAAPLAATATTWSSAIAYYNPDAAGDLVVTYYNADGSVAAESDAISIPSHGSGTLMIGDLGTLPSDFGGSAVISSGVPLVAVYKQFPGGTDTNYSPVFYSAFSADQAGNWFWIPSWVRFAGSYTQLGIQNLEDSEISVHVALKNTANTITNHYSFDIAAGGNKLVTYKELAEVGTAVVTPFDGAAMVEAVIKGTTDPADIVVAAQDLYTAGRRAYAYEGVNSGATELYMPNAMCNVGTTKQTTLFAIQNTDSVSTGAIFAEFYTDAGALIVRYKLAKSLVPGQRVTLNPCSARAMAGKTGTAKIYATTGTLYTSPRVQIAAVGKAQSNDGLLTAYTGAAAGATLVHLPYVRWASAGENTAMFIQNTTTSAANVSVKYYNADGDLVATHNVVVPAKGKKNSNPSMVPSSLTSGTFIGAVTVTSTQPVVVLARTQKRTTIVNYKTLGEDYIGIAGD